MRYLIGFARIIVGILFIISGFIKLNDPVGFSFKLEEYFSQGVLDLPFLMPYALVIAIVVVLFEVVLGFFLLVGFQRKFTVWSLLLMIVFFTFLTFYSAYFNKVTDCGCFGDAIKLTPWESFTKDLILLVLIVLLFMGRRYITPVFDPAVNRGILMAALLASIGYVYYVLNHLPVLDFRPYKIGANIPDGMRVPADAPKAIFEYAWKFDVDGEEKVIVTNGEYPTVDGEFIGVETKEVQKGYEPPIHDFTIEQDGEDIAATLLQEKKLILVIAYDLAKSATSSFPAIKKVTDKALSQGYKVAGLSASSSAISAKVIADYKLDFKFYFTDETTLKTIVRSNPGILVLEKGTIRQKLHYNDLENIELVETNTISEINYTLKKNRDSILVLDQKYLGDRTPENWKLQEDISNLFFVEKILKKHGYPGTTLVGSGSNTSMVHDQHSDKIPEYGTILREAAERKEVPYRQYAIMLDRPLLYQNEPLHFGKQGSSYF